MFADNQTNPLAVRRLELELVNFSLSIELNNGSIIRLLDGVQDVLNEAAAFNKVSKCEENRILINVQMNPLNGVDGFEILV